MADLFSKNGFNVLGLDISSTQKEINHRAKELSNLLKIDEVPEYDQDLKILKPVRTDNSVKLALQNLTSPTKRISEYFYWFDSANTDIDDDFKKLQNNRTAEVVTDWHKSAEQETAKGFIAKRNLAVLLTILASTGTKQYLNRSIRTWQEIVESEKFWSSFTKIYQLNDELGTSVEAVSSFKSGVVNTLSDYYTDVSKELGDNNFVAEFQRAFKVKGAKVEKDLLAPIYETINNASMKLKNIKITDEKLISKEKLDELKSLVIILRNSFNKLKDIGLYNDSQSKAMRDKAAESMRSVGLNLYNNLNDAAKSGSILKIALEICGTPTLKARLEDDLSDLRRLVGRDKIMKPITDLQEAGKYAEALDLIVDTQSKYPKDKELQEFLAQRLKWCLTELAIKQFNEGKKLYDDKDYSEAVNLLTSNVEFIYSYLEDTNISKEYVDDMIAEINRLTELLGKDQRSGQAVDSLRSSVVEQAEKHFKDQFESSILIILIDSVITGNLAAKIPQLQRQKHVKSLIGWAITIGIFIIIGVASSHSSNSSNSGSGGSGSTGASSSGSSSGNSSQAYNDCVTQYNSLKSQLDSVNAQETSYQSSGDTTDYNNLIPQQNSLVQQVNDKATECNGLR
jgi:hypothetical protein